MNQYFVYNSGWRNEQKQWDVLVLWLLIWVKKNKILCGCSIKECKNIKDTRFNYSHKILQTKVQPIDIDEFQTFFQEHELSRSSECFRVCYKNFSENASIIREACRNIYENWSISKGHWQSNPRNEVIFSSALKIGAITKISICFAGYRITDSCCATESKSESWSLSNTSKSIWEHRRATKKCSWLQRIRNDTKKKLSSKMKELIFFDKKTLFKKFLHYTLCTMQLNNKYYYQSQMSINSRI